MSGDAITANETLTGIEQIAVNDTVVASATDTFAAPFVAAKVQMVAVTSDAAATFTFTGSTTVVTLAANEIWVWTATRDDAFSGNVTAIAVHNTSADLATVKIKILIAE
jgi:hypothetical protein